jgi:hypothetical protein
VEEVVTIREAEENVDWEMMKEDVSSFDMEDMRDTAVEQSSFEEDLEEIEDHLLEKKWILAYRWRMIDFSSWKWIIV